MQESLVRIYFEKYLTHNWAILCRIIKSDLTDGLTNRQTDRQINPGWAG